MIGPVNPAQESRYACGRAMDEALSRGIRPETLISMVLVRWLRDNVAPLRRSTIPKIQALLDGKA
jgi:hypothetical protein